MISLIRHSAVPSNCWIDHNGKKSRWLLAEANKRERSEDLLLKPSWFRVPIKNIDIININLHHLWITFTKPNLPKRIEPIHDRLKVVPRTSFWTSDLLCSLVFPCGQFRTNCHRSPWCTVLTWGRTLIKYQMKRDLCIWAKARRHILP